MIATCGAYVHANAPLTPHTHKQKTQSIPPQASCDFVMATCDAYMRANTPPHPHTPTHNLHPQAGCDFVMATCDAYMRANPGQQFFCRPGDAAPTTNSVCAFTGLARAKCEEAQFADGCAMKARAFRSVGIGRWGPWGAQVASTPRRPHTHHATSH